MFLYGTCFNDMCQSTGLFHSSMYVWQKTLSDEVGAQGRGEFARPPSWVAGPKTLGSGCPAELHGGDSVDRMPG